MKLSLKLEYFIATVSFYIFLLNLFANHHFEAIYLSIAPLLLIPLLLSIGAILHQVLLKSLAVILIMLASGSIFFKWKYNIVITEDILLSGLINDFSLTQEIISISFLVWVFLTAIIPLIIIILIQIKKYKKRTALYCAITVVILLSTVAYFQGYKYRKPGQIRDFTAIKAISAASPIDLIVAYKKAVKSLKILKKTYTKAKSNQVENYILDNKNDNLIVVVVVGESSRADHFSLNGYKKETNQYLKTIPHLYSFKNVTSCDTLTIRSLAYMFTPLQCDTQLAQVQEESFVTIMQRLGFNVHIYSLQTLSSFYRFLGYDTLVSKYAVINEQNFGTRDKALLPYLHHTLQNYKEGKMLIILHTLGSHQSYIDRLDTDDIKFKPICTYQDVKRCSQKILINTYDNTIVAIDKFLFSIINKLQDKNAILFYISDHGESLGENGFYFHGYPKNSAPKEQFKVPFIVWMSDTYLHYAEAKNLQYFVQTKGLDANITHDYLFHTILGCSQIVSDGQTQHQSLNLCSNPSSQDSFTTLLKSPKK
ncbi:MAG: lipid A phosphoethanolamine transferase [Sulfurovum sp.]|nr:lipid A phosphoethanolamine transferase [Sulfurovum sp.]